MAPYPTMLGIVDVGMVARMRADQADRTLFARSMRIRQRSVRPTDRHVVQ